jgi:hypothetical protein
MSCMHTAPLSFPFSIARTPRSLARVSSVAFDRTMKKGALIWEWMMVTLLFFIGVAAVITKRFYGRHDSWLTTDWPAVAIGSVCILLALYFAYLIRSSKSASRLSPRKLKKRRTT